MKIEDIQKEWDSDSEVDASHLSDQISKIPYLHSKYMKILFDEKMIKSKIDRQIDELLPDKTMYYRGKLDEETITKRGWKPFNLFLTAQDTNMYLTADKELADLKQRKGIVEEKIRYVEEIIKQVNQRNFLIKNLIDWQRFTSGSN